MLPAVLYSSDDNGGVRQSIASAFDGWHRQRPWGERLSDYAYLACNGLSVDNSLNDIYALRELTDRKRIAISRCNRSTVSREE